MRLTEAQLAALRAQGRITEHRIQPKPQAKYRNRRTIYEGIAFDSKKEAARWEELLLLQRAGEIQDLVRQVSYRIEINEQLICIYRADFRYRRSGKVVVEDAKGIFTAVYLLKKKLMRAVHGIEILET